MTKLINCLTEEYFKSLDIALKMVGGEYGVRIEAYCNDNLGLDLVVDGVDIRKSINVNMLSHQTAMYESIKTAYKETI